MSNNKNLLKLVWDSVSETVHKSHKDGVQMDLFARNKEKSIVVIFLGEVDKNTFVYALRDSHPRHVIDLRLNPRFDMLGYSRKMAFLEFKSIGANYSDIVDLLGENKEDKSLIPEVIESEYINKADKGPLAFIFGKKEHDAIFEEELISKLPIKKSGWSLSIFP